VKTNAPPYDRIVAILERDFADELRVIPAAAGVHLATLRDATFGLADRPDHRSCRDGRRRGAGDCGVAVDHEPRPGILFGYGAIAREHIEEGLERLRATFDDR
jgi:GntR family transcriptional regulator/MocR family aminotransferase